ncbi:hypothetical protein D0Z07_2503 [Hyphodiscus hymeniophilus]|uniref:Uncharacterized protein n=1 Tax=Hyphodiscus hymeniophilus TaxID=353542 RepID=A0A9P7AZE3_9HELO|nr:hypothetical protein D0Z07_2503 [Hyphodiscus hymeniophilus]
MWVMGDPPTAFSSTDSDALSTMAYQYPMGGPGLESSSNMIPSYHHLPGEHTQPDSPADANPSSPNSKNRGASTGHKSAKIKRSMSTPNVRGQSTADAAALALLKKECNFYPVDQQPAPEPRRRGSKAQSGTGRASESSSPSTSSGQPPELPTTLPYPHMSMPPIQDLGGPHMKKSKTESFAPENKVITSSRNFDYHHGATNWMASEASPSTSKTPSDMPPYWRVNPQDSPMTPAFSPFTPSHQIPPPQNWPTSQAEPVQRDEMTWSVPQRSISYSNLESLHNQNQYSPYSNSHSQAPPLSDHYSTKPRTMQSGMFPPSISTASNILPPPEIVSATSSEGSHHPHSAGPHYPHWQQPYPPYQKPTSESYGSWNGSHAGPPHIPEEAHAPPAAYAYGEPPSNMFYPPPPQGR